MTIKDIKARLYFLHDEESARFALRYFKTGPGEYAEGDRFLGIRAPVLRQLAKEYQDIKLTEAKQLLRSSFHEERVLALLVLVRIYSKGDEAAKKKIYELYLENTRFINNWDLVDVSAPQIVGHYLTERSKKPLYSLAKSRSLWERRISIIATAYFIKLGQFTETIKISEILLTDKEDLIHKAVGWMLREIGKRSILTEEEFLNRHYKHMPRTMLRYAIEKFPESKRQSYLKGLI
jgi:3-methyladenine DNA glycosylase AlkD